MELKNFRSTDCTRFTLFTSFSLNTTLVRAKKTICSFYFVCSLSLSLSPPPSSMDTRQEYGNCFGFLFNFRCRKSERIEFHSLLYGTKRRSEKSFNRNIHRSLESFLKMFTKFFLFRGEDVAQSGIFQLTSLSLTSASSMKLFMRMAK